MQEADLIKIKHMFDAASEILEYTKGKTRNDFESERILNLSVVHLLEILGEAAAGISSEVQVQHEKIPWKAIIAMRNRLIHRYFDINLDIVWETIKQDIPPLVPTLKEIIDLHDS